MGAIVTALSFATHERFHQKIEELVRNSFILESIRLDYTGGFFQRFTITCTLFGNPR